MSPRKRIALIAGYAVVTIAVGIAAIMQSGPTAPTLAGADWSGTISADDESIEAVFTFSHDGTFTVVYPTLDATFPQGAETATWALDGNIVTLTTTDADREAPYVATGLLDGDSLVVTYHDPSGYSNTISLTRDPSS